MVNTRSYEKRFLKRRRYWYLYLGFRWDLNQKINDNEDNIRKAIDKALELKRLGTVEMEKAQALLHHDLDVIRKLKADLEVLHCSL